MSADTPFVTVVTATWNWATVLPFAIGSVLDQTFHDFELLVVGDACTDESADVVSEIAARDGRVRWINLEKNFGHQWGPNSEGIRQARGEVIAYLGHDDLWASTHLANLVSAFERGAKFAHSAVLLVHPTDPPERFPFPDWSYDSTKWIPPTSFAHTRAIAAVAGGWRHPRENEAQMPDADFVRRIAERTPLVPVPRLDCVKLSAQHRRDVYSLRPTHEQAWWLDRLRAADDPERMLEDCVGRPYELATELAPESHLSRFRRFLRRAALKAIGRNANSAEEQLRTWRKWKGIR